MTLVLFILNAYLLYKSNIYMTPTYMWSSYYETVLIKRFPDRQIELENYKNNKPDWSNSSYLFSLLPKDAQILLLSCIAYQNQKGISFSS